MAISILSTDFKTAQDAIVKKFQENSQKTSKEITTWELKGSATKGYELHYIPPNWGVCGYFALQEYEKKLRLALFYYKEHHQNGDKWPTSKGALHGDLLQLLMNHFPDFSKKDGEGLKVLNTWNKVE